MARSQKSPAENVQEVVDLVKAYALQETAVPLQGIGRYLKHGVPGAILIGTGLFFLALALLRGLQEFEVFNGGDDGTGFGVVAPYGIVFAASAGVLAFLATRITKGLD